jgi:hypothetical protein
LNFSLYRRRTLRRHGTLVDQSQEVIHRPQPR